MIVMIDFDMCLFLLYVYLYYLWNLFVFVGKNIACRLPSMKLVLSIVLHWISSQSSLYIRELLYHYTIIQLLTKGCFTNKGFLETTDSLENTKKIQREKEIFLAKSSKNTKIVYL